VPTFVKKKSPTGQEESHVMNLYPCRGHESGNGRIWRDRGRRVSLLNRVEFQKKLFTVQEKERDKRRKKIEGVVMGKY